MFCDSDPPKRFLMIRNYCTIQFLCISVTIVENLTL